MDKTRMEQVDTEQILREAFHAESAGNLDVAIRLFKRAARRGSNDARSKLGTIYDDLVHPSNPLKAAYWYKSAVRRGDVSCAWNLAMHYAGLGRKRGYLRWLRIAVEMGDPDAKLELINSIWWNKRNAAGRTQKTAV